MNERALLYRHTWSDIHVHVYLNYLDLEIGLLKLLVNSICF